MSVRPDGVPEGIPEPRRDPDPDVVEDLERERELHELAARRREEPPTLDEDAAAVLRGHLGSPAGRSVSRGPAPGRRPD